MEGGRFTCFDDGIHNISGVGYWDSMLGSEVGIPMRYSLGKNWNWTQMLIAKGIVDQISSQI